LSYSIYHLSHILFKCFYDKTVRLPTMQLEAFERERERGRERERERKKKVRKRKLCTFIKNLKVAAV
ncbi:MAG: hypothetical protein J8272_00765, partial ['Prunus persica' phytoplasma PP2]|nr:hypothetical protein ['Prunus persica' phytoplasma PP2]